MERLACLISILLNYYYCFVLRSYKVEWRYLLLTMKCLQASLVRNRLGENYAALKTIFHTSNVSVIIVVRCETNKTPERRF